MIERVWKPLDVRGLRLYAVHGGYTHHPAIVAANAPMDAADLMRKLNPQYGGSFQGSALNILQPRVWWDGPAASSLDHKCNGELLSSGRGAGNGESWDESAWICPTCGKINVRVWRNGTRSEINLTIDSLDHILAIIAGAKARGADVPEFKEKIEADKKL